MRNEVCLARPYYVLGQGSRTATPPGDHQQNAEAGVRGELLTIQPVHLAVSEAPNGKDEEAGDPAVRDRYVEMVWRWALYVGSVFEDPAM